MLGARKTVNFRGVPDYIDINLGAPAFTRFVTRNLSHYLTFWGHLVSTGRLDDTGPPQSVEASPKSRSTLMRSVENEV